MSKQISADGEVAHDRSNSVPERIGAYDWSAAGAELDAHGCAVLPKLLSAGECRRIAALYADEAQFRSRVVMARHGFGKGEYKYFKYPLPALIGALRSALYARVAPIANAWNAQMNGTTRYPPAHDDYLKLCHKAGRRGRRLCCCNTGRAISIACIRISTANWRSRCR